MVGSTKDDAQRRADQIRAFRAELDTLRREGIDILPGDGLDAVFAHQDALLASSRDRFDIDITPAARHMSLGMRVASAFGGAALTAAVVSFFYRIWGGLGTPTQVMLLTAAPLVALAAMVMAARRERTLYVASLCALVACGGFVLQVVMLQQTFNLRTSAHVLAACAAFALSVAVPLRLVLPFAAGTLAAILYGAALLAGLLGMPWTAFLNRPELVLVSSAAALPAQRLAPVELQRWARGVALGVLLFVVLVLSMEARSLIPVSRGNADLIYQLLATVLGVAVIAFGIRRGALDVVTIGACFTGLFLLSRFVDWWWDWMPKYLFFLIIAAVAIAWLAALARLRRRAAAGWS